MGILSLNVNQLHSYECCPARFYLESRSVKSHLQHVRTAFDAKKILFRELFSLHTDSSKVRLRKAEKVIAKYAELLKNETLSARIMAVHLIKTYEKLVSSLASETYEVPTPLSLKVSQGQYLLYSLDLIAINQYRTTFVVLVPSEYWTAEDISHKFDNMIISRLVWPNLGLTDSKNHWRICYYCPDNGKSCIINSGQVRTFGLDSIEKRMLRVFTEVNQHRYGKEPVGFKCERCPVYDQCKPNQFVSSTFNERVETIEPPLVL